MYRRVLSVACAASPNAPSQQQPQLAPRPDVDLSEQRRLVAQERAEQRAKQLKIDRGSSLYGVLAPQEEARVMEFNRHSLRLLVLEAHQRQVQQHQAAGLNHAGTRHVDPHANIASVDKSARGGDSSSHVVDGRPRGRITPPPESHFDLSQKPNFDALLQDIDTLMAVAQAKPPQTRDRILNQTYEQLARLSLWNDQQ